MLETVTLVDVLFWIIVVFVAGFIGYFGRHLSKMIIRRFSRKKTEQPKSEAQKSPRQLKTEMDYKLQKKRLKLEKKKLKLKKKD
jgi:hypothetical protein